MDASSIPVEKHGQTVRSAVCHRTYHGQSTRFCPDTIQMHRNKVVNGCALLAPKADSAIDDMSRSSDILQFKMSAEIGCVARCCGADLI